MELLDGHIMCDVDGCSSTNEWVDIIEFMCGNEHMQICESCMHNYVRPKMKLIEVHHQEKVYGKDK